MTDPSADDMADRSSDGQTSDQDSDRSLFADLIDRIEENRSKWEDHRTTIEATNQTEQDPPTEADPLDRVRELIPDGLRPPPTDPTPHSKRDESTGNRRLYMGIILGLVIALVLPGIVAASVGHVTDTVLAPPPSNYVGENDTLYLESDDATYLSRIFRETTHEVAYCGLVTHNEDRPTLTVWMANTVNAGPKQVEFITENCPDATREVLIHTHPGGTLQLSRQDKQTLAGRSERFMCVQAGPINADPGREAENFACYQQSESTGDGLVFVRHRVVVI